MKRLCSKAIILIWASLTVAAVFSAPNSVFYTMAPPFIQSNIGDPNVVISLDVSSSMQKGAYSTYNATQSFYGYFNQNKKYRYDSGSGKEYFIEDNNGDWDGRFLNWLTMRRIDIARKVLVGGKIANRSGSWIDGAKQFILEGDDGGKTFYKTPAMAANHSPFPNNTKFAFNYGEFSRAGDVVRLNGNVEIGKVNATEQWQPVTFVNVYSEPPAVVAPSASFKNTDPVHPRIRNVTAKGFEIRLEEWTYLDGVHPAEEVSYIVSAVNEGGSIFKVDGKEYRVVAGKVDTSAALDFANSMPWEKVDVKTALNGPPVLTTVTIPASTTCVAPPPTDPCSGGTATMTGSTSTSSSGSGTSSATISGSVSSGCSTATLSGGSTSTSTGTNTTMNTTATGGGSATGTSTATNGSGSSTASSTSTGAGGTTTFTNSAGEICTTTPESTSSQYAQGGDSLDNPAVFVSVGSYNDPIPVIVRVKNVDKDNFEFIMQHDESERTIPHGRESVHWVVFESVAGELGTSEPIQIGRTDNEKVSSKWYTHKFQDNLFTKEPDMLVAGSHTTMGEHTAHPRYGDGGVTREYVKFLIEEEQSVDINNFHAGETVSYLALQKNARFKIRVVKKDLPKGLIQNNSRNIRFGLAVFNYEHSPLRTVQTSRNIGGATFKPCYANRNKPLSEQTHFDICYDTHVKAPVDNLIHVIEDYPLVEDQSPLAEAMFDIYSYFSQVNYGRNGHTQWFNNGTEGITGTAQADGRPMSRNSYDINNNWDPFYYDDLRRKIPCSLAFVINISDGEMEGDFLASYTTDRVYNPNTGYYNTTSVSDNPSVPNDGVGLFGPNEMLDDVALMMREQDCRTEPGMEGHQALVSYYVNVAMGENQSNNQNTRKMREAAANGGFEDLPGSENDYPDPQHPNDFVQYVNQGICPRNEWDLNGNCDPDTFYFANDEASLLAQLDHAIADVSRRIGAGGAASVLSTSRTGEGAVYYALFDPSVTSGADMVTWVGDVQGMLIDDEGNLRSDDGDKRLGGPATDNYVDMCNNEETGEVLVKLSLSHNDRPTADQTNVCSPAVFNRDLSNLGYLWSGSEWLSNLTDLEAAHQQRIYASTQPGRHIITGVDSDGDGIITPGEVTPFMPGSFTEQTAGMLAGSTSWAEKTVRFVRGEDQWGMRSRLIDGKTLRLGDVVYSTPTVVGRPSENLDLLYGSTSYKAFFQRYRNRRQVVYAGGNDGMLHAFNGGWFNESDKQFKKAQGGSSPGSQVQFDLGAELWSYVPYHALPHLEYLTRPNYGKVVADHLYFVDLAPRVFDAKVFTPDADHPGGWGTLLVAGMRLGGGATSVDADLTAATDFRDFRSSYMIFDVTNPDKPPKLLMEFAHPELGFTLVQPTPVVNGNDREGNGNWYLMLGSGPDNTRRGFIDVKSRSNAKLFLLDLKTIAQGQANALVNSFGNGGIYALPDADSYITNLVVADFDLDNFTTDAVYISTVSGFTGNWGGKIYRMVIQEETGALTKLLPQWMPTLMYNPNQPVTAPVAVASDAQKNRWVFVGTGRFFNRLDNLDLTQGLYLGLKERRDSSGRFTYQEITQLTDVTATEVNSMTGVLSNTPALSPALPGQARLSDLKKRLASYGDPVSYVDGWMRRFEPAERNVGAANVLGGSLSYLTYNPKLEGCKVEGVSHLYVLDGGTGTAGYPGIIPNTTASLYNEYKLEVGNQPSTTPGVHLGTGYKTVSRSKTVIQSSDGALKSIEQNNPNKIMGGEASWRELKQ